MSHNLPPRGWPIADVAPRRPVRENPFPGGRSHRTHEVPFMPTIRADKAKGEYDVVIVGSGAGGGQAAYTLTLAGLKCVMLEAGRSYDVVNETPMWNTPAQAPLMATATPDKPFGFYD